MEEKEIQQLKQTVAELQAHRNSLVGQLNVVDAALTANLRILTNFESGEWQAKKKD